MGARLASGEGEGRLIQDAFRQAREEARREYGSRGYTGSLAEKDRFHEFEVPDGVDVYEVPDLVEMLRYAPERVPAHLVHWLKLVRRVSDDKWGPAVALFAGAGRKPGTRRWFFFGYASS